MPYRVTHIRKPGGAHNTHEHITHIRIQQDPGTSVYDETVETAITSIKSGSRYFVRRGGFEIDVEVASRNGREYIKTKPDSTGVDNLLSLPSF